MAKIEKVDTGAPVGGAYSPGLKVGNLLFVSGQGAADPKTNKMEPSIESQVIATLNNLKNIVVAGGSSVKNIVKMSVFMKDISQFSKMNETYRKWLEDNGAGDRFPTRTTVEAKFARDDMLIEIDCIAVLD